MERKIIKKKSGKEVCGWCNSADQIHSSHDKENNYIPEKKMVNCISLSKPIANIRAE